MSLPSKPPRSRRRLPPPPTSIRDLRVLLAGCAWDMPTFNIRLLETAPLPLCVCVARYEQTHCTLHHSSVVLVPLDTPPPLLLLRDDGTMGHRALPSVESRSPTPHSRQLVMLLQVLGSRSLLILTSNSSPVAGHPLIPIPRWTTSARSTSPVNRTAAGTAVPRRRERGRCSLVWRRTRLRCRSTTTDGAVVAKETLAVSQDKSRLSMWPRSAQLVDR